MKNNIDYIALFVLGFLSIVWISSVFSGGDTIAIGGDICQVGIAGVLGYMSNAAKTALEESEAIKKLQAQIDALTSENEALRSINHQ